MGGRLLAVTIGDHSHWLCRLVRWSPYFVVEAVPVGQLLGIIAGPGACGVVDDSGRPLLPNLQYLSSIWFVGASGALVRST